MRPAKFRRVDNEVMISVVVITATLCFATGISEDHGGSAWADATELIRAHRGWVNKGFSGNDTQHGGFTLRGVVADRLMRPGSTVAEIPRSLWITLDSFPKVRDSPIQDTPDCKTANERGDLAILKFAGALALEGRKGLTSKYNLYLRDLPTMNDFEQFHPLFAEPAVFSDFAGLRIMDAVQDRRKWDEVMKHCFYSWKKVSQSPVADLDWSEVMLALMRIRTRNFDSSDYASQDGSGVLVPALDLLNTERSDKVNAEYMIIRRSPGDVSRDVFKIKVVGNGVAEGGELYDEYCHGCDNSYMLFSWGVYLENNLNNTWHYGADCRASSHSDGDAGTSTSADRLLRSTRDMLSLDNAAMAHASGWTAPRCREDKIRSSGSSRQGPLRCSLARLAWEECHVQWMQKDRKQVLATRVSEVTQKTGATHAFLGSHLQ